MSRTDQELIGDFQAGDDLAFVVIYNRYKHDLVFFCYKMLQDQTVAQDIAQETFLKVYLKRDSLHCNENFKSYLFTIARNLCLNQLRNRKNTVNIDDDKPLLNYLIAEDQNSKAIEKNDILNRALFSLSNDYREMVLLRDYEGFSYQEIAAVTHASVSAVKSKLFKARQKLREILLPMLQ